MTRDEIFGRVSQNLEDSGLVHFVQDDLVDSVQDGYEIIALLAQTIERATTVAFVANQTYYNLYNLISDFYRVFAIYNTSTKKWMEPVAYHEIRENSHRWETVKGAPREWAPLGYSHIAIFPKPATTVGSMLIFYKGTAPTLTGSLAPEFPISEHESLVDYGTGDLLDQDLEYTKSLEYMRKFYARLQEIHKQVHSRDLIDRVYALAAQQFTPLVG